MYLCAIYDFVMSLHLFYARRLEQKPVQQYSSDYFPEGSIYISLAISWLPYARRYGKGGTVPAYGRCGAPDARGSCIDLSNFRIMFTLVM